MEKSSKNRDFQTPRLLERRFFYGIFKNIFAGFYNILRGKNGGFQHVVCFMLIRWKMASKWEKCV
ncbi:hypothetical protein CLOSTASPAR_01736 [[Clostridium] asparagiforme DSM 15981]|uniref:Uncharacterized protein n=1 Tax=[Clostridium] asparagiforme DSM 15981 TaxID=518636 RepID=C0CXL2_9FIRM|nr:hypothetical protein CLOSTASPAR_01736 [[Clostridium] asparagiforme DSM 15981]